MGGAMFPPCCLTWGQTMVEVMKIMATSLKMSCVNTASLGAPDPAAGRRQPLPLPETPGPTRACLGQSLVGSLLLPPGFWCVQGSVCASKSLFPQPCVSSGGSMVGLMVTSSKRAYAIPMSAVPRAPASAAGHCWPIPLQETLRHSSVSVSVGSLWDLCCAQCLFEPFEHPWRVWGLILPFCWGGSLVLRRGVFFLVGPNILLSMVVQQWAVILEFSQEKMSSWYRDIAM